MDSLRRDILCAADDTPRYTTITKSPESAIGQVRMCRDWGRLKQLGDQFERFRVCPEGSGYEEKVKEHFADAEAEGERA
ncbi:hypothetical protein MMC13_007074 [Lambiella insularis]|nr:hypothetical protein [Lambiella insularis]